MVILMCPSDHQLFLEAWSTWIQSWLWHNHGPTHAFKAQTCPHHFGNISMQNAFSEKYLKEKCWSKLKQQHSVKKIENSWLIPKLSSKVSEVQTILEETTFRHEGVNADISQSETTASSPQGEWILWSAWGEVELELYRQG